MVAEYFKMIESSLSRKAFLQMNNDNLIVRRERLMARLHAGRYKKLIALIAPAGYGKSTVIKEWLAEDLRDARASGVVFDTTDNTVPSFWRLVFECLAQADQSWSVDPGRFSQACGADEIARMIQELFEHLDKRTSHLYLVLDNYHVITDPEVEAMMSFFITHAPDHLHFIIAGRSVPNLPFASLRVKDQLFEINQKALSFSAPECEAFFGKVKGIDLSNKDVHRTKNMSEGWAAALQLVGESLVELGGASRITKAFEHSREYIYQYFEEEVLAYASEELLFFLLRISLFGSFSADLCNSVLGIDNSTQLLEEAERKQLFISATTDRQKWFTFHTLFGEYLFDTMGRRYPGKKAAIQQLAISWFRENGSAHLAVPLLIDLGELDEAAQTVNENFMAYKEDAFFDIYRQIDFFPHDYLVTNARLLCQQALVGTMLGRTGNAQRLLTIAAMVIKREVEAVELVSDPNTHKLYDIARGLLLCDNKQYAEAMPLLQKSLADPGPFGFLDLHIRMRLSHAYFNSGELDRCLEFINGAITSAWNQDTMASYCLALCEKATIKYEQAKLNEADALYEKAYNFARKHQLPEDSRIIASMGMWEVAHERMERTPDDTLVGYGEVFAGQDSGVRPWTQTIFVGLRLVQFLTEKRLTDLAIFCINHVRAKDSNDMLSSELYGDSISGELCLWLAEGKRSQIKRWVLATEQEFDEHKTTILRALQLGNMLVYLAQYERAIKVLDWVSDEAVKTGRFNAAVRAFVGAGIARCNLGKLEKARACLVEALLLAQEGEYKRVFVSEKALCQKLLTQIRDDCTKRPDRYKELDVGYLDSVLRAFEPEGESSRLQEQHYTLPGVIMPVYANLTSKEKEVLHLIAEDMRAKDIAAEMTVSPATAKTHIRNIYRKLGLHNHREAVQLARSLAPWR